MFYVCDVLDTHLWSQLRSDIRELKQRRRRGEWERQKTQHFARASRFFVHFLAVVARLQRKSALFHVLLSTGTQDYNFLFLFLNFDTVLWNSTLKKVTIIWRFKRDGIRAIKFQAARIHFLSDVFVAVAVVVPYCFGNVIALQYGDTRKTLFNTYILL